MGPVSLQMWRKGKERGDRQSSCLIRRSRVGVQRGYAAGKGGHRSQGRSWHRWEEIKESVKKLCLGKQEATAGNGERLQREEGLSNAVMN